MKKLVLKIVLFPVYLLAVILKKLGMPYGS